MAYKFISQLDRGKVGEAFLDRFFSKSKTYIVSPATPTQQRQGIDRIFSNSKESFSVEYKTDLLAHRTGNAFIETISVDIRCVPGWAESSRAYYLAYYLPQSHLIYWIRMASLRQQLGRWKRLYPVKKVANQGWNTIGLLVPLSELETLAEEVINL